MSKPQTLCEKAYPLKVRGGKKYKYCTCDLSKKMPICDGSHKGTGFKSLKFYPEEDHRAWLCMCHKSGNLPYCDGTLAGRSNPPLIKRAFKGLFKRLRRAV